MGSNEEADGIIVLALRQVGCALPEEVTGIAGFVTEELVRAVSHCLHVIGDESAAEYSKVGLPKEMSARFRACTELADSVKKLGFKQEIGFHQFLYPSDKFSRDLFAFLLERLPQAQTLGGDSIAEGSSALRRNISTAIASRRAIPPMPHACRPRSLRGALNHASAWGYPSVPVTTRPLLFPSGEKGGEGPEPPFVWDQALGHHGLAPAVFEANASAADRARDSDLDPETPEEARVKRAAFEKMVREVLRDASGAAHKAGDSLSALLEEWGGKTATSSRFARAAEFGQDRAHDIVALDEELTREERVKLAAQEREARLEREEETRVAEASEMREHLEARVKLAALEREARLEREEETRVAEASEMREHLEAVSAAAEQLGGDHAQLVESQRVLDETLDREAERTVRPPLCCTMASGGRG
ncbi:hypothetical protein T484DRAFT_1844278 [Baffinella frigidus]|nr:hypothetical protein T484DRAFT_1844278 [Cryptophyta sp. CCMP2293]